jgi:hypothetical protein
MVSFAAILFGVSLCGIALLFAHKYREEHAGHVLVSETLREAGDERALALKDFLALCRAEAATWPPRFLVWLQGRAHASALGVAVVARSVERFAYHLADRFSHKHHFERREPQSEFLKKVSDFKNTDEVAPLE